MHITKLEHSGLLVQTRGPAGPGRPGPAALLIDPGSFTAPGAMPPGAMPAGTAAVGAAAAGTAAVGAAARLVAVVVTHEHADHWTAENLRAAREASPDVVILGPAGMASAAQAHGIPVTVVSPGQVVRLGSFELRFTGGRHALLHRDIPRVDNVGVLVNDALYYPGDSLDVPPIRPRALAAPISAPWLQVGDAIDFVTATGADVVFGTHDALLSPAGRELHGRLLTTAARQAGGRYQALRPGDTLALAADPE